MHFEAKEIHYVIKFFLFTYVKNTTLISALNASSLKDLNDKFARLTLNINKII